METTDLVPRMSKEEIGLLDTCLNLCRGQYFEFGCGGSTYRAALCPSIAHITSVESSQPWIDKVSNNPLVDETIKRNKLNFVYVDINTNDLCWGCPKDKSKINNWPIYSRSINNTHMIYDLVLVDGRFRVACALHALSALSSSSLLLIHDYTDRPQYHCIENFYDILVSVHTLTVFKKKQHYDDSLLQTLIQKYELIWN